MSPEKIGRYEIVGELGRGAMGLVYKATDPNIGRTVALKTMRLDVSGVEEQDMLRRFKHEARLAGVMNHPNIVTIYDAGEDEGVFYIAMEYVDGRTLQSILHEERVLNPKQIIDISRQICAGLDYAHVHGVIHRDIKPGNIMVGPEGAAKIMDFGIAKSSTGMTSAGQVLGTPTYMSPEQVKGRALDGRTDLFSWGVVLYEMVTGEKPFTGESLTTIIYKIIHEHPTPPRDLDVSVHPGLNAIVTKSIAKNADDRYQNGAELINDLENYKAVGGDTEGTRVMAAAPETNKVAAVSSVRMPASAQPTVITPSTGNSAAAVAPAMAAIDSTISVPPKPPDSLHPPKKNQNTMIAGGVAVVLALAAGVGILKHKASPPLAQPVAQAQQQTAPATPGSGSSASAPGIALNNPSADQPTSPALTAGATPLQEKIPEKIPEKTAAKQVVERPKKPKEASSAKELPKAVVAEKKTSSARINSEPSGAKVTIGGAVSAEWVTPFTVAKLDPGNYDVTFSKPGYLPQTVNMKVEVGRPSSASATLVMAGALLDVSSTPSGANIIVDGNPTGKVTPAQISVDAGQHRVMVKKQGFREENTAISLKDGQSYKYAPTLDERPSGSEKNPFAKLGRFFGGKSIPEGKGVLVIKTRPAGAQVVHNGQLAPVKTPTRFPMLPGSYNIILQLEGYQPVQRQFTVEKGKITDLSVDMVPVKK